MFNALVRFLRTRSTVPHLVPRVVRLLSQLLMAPDMFLHGDHAADTSTTAPLPDLTTLQGTEDAVIERCKASGAASLFLPSGLLELVHLVVARRTCMRYMKRHAAGQAKDGGSSLGDGDSGDESQDASAVKPCLPKPATSEDSLAERTMEVHDMVEALYRQRPGSGLVRIPPAVLGHAFLEACVLSRCVRGGCGCVAVAVAVCVVLWLWRWRWLFGCGYGCGCGCGSGCVAVAVCVHPTSRSPLLPQSRGVQPPA